MCIVVLVRSSLKCSTCIQICVPGLRIPVNIKYTVPGFMHRRLCSYFLSRSVQSPHFAYNQPSRSGLGKNHCHVCTTDLHHDSGLTNSKDFSQYHIKGYTLNLIHVHILGVRSPDFTHSQLRTSGQEKINVMCVQMTYILI